jgi:hypothetical protein
VGNWDEAEDLGPYAGFALFGGKAKGMRFVAGSGTW